MKRLFWILFFGIITHDVWAQLPRLDHARTFEIAYKDSLKTVAKRILRDLERQVASSKNLDARKQALKLLGAIYLEEGFESLDTSFAFSQKLYDLGKDTGDKEVMMTALLRQEIKYQRTSDYANSLAVSMEALKLCEALGKNCTEYWRIQRNIGQSFTWLGNYESAEKYLLSSLEGLEKTPYLDNLLKIKQIHNSYSVIGKMYKNWGKVEKAQFFLNKQLEIGHQSGNKQNIGRTYEEIGDFKNSLQQPDAAIPYLQKALILFEETRYTTGIASVYNSFGETYILKKDYARAKEYLKKAIDLSIAHNYPILKRYAYESLANAYQQTGDELLALRARNEMTRLRDSLNLEQRLLSMVNVRRLYETDRLRLESDNAKIQQALKVNQMQKQYEIDFLKSESEKTKLRQAAQLAELQRTLGTQKAIALARQIKTDSQRQQQQQEAKIRQLQVSELNQELVLQNRTRNLLLGILALLAALGILLGLYTRRLRLKNQELARKNREIQEAYLKGQTTERKRVATELHDNLGGLLSAAKMSLSILDPSELNWREREIYDGVLGMVSDACREVRSISHNMLPDELQQEGLASALQKIITKFNFNNSVQFSLNLEELPANLLPETEFNLYMVALELCNNILKHSQAKQASLVFSQSEKNLLFFVTDNGKGMKNSFTPSNGGMGLKNMEQRIGELGGTMQIETQPHYGTTVKISVPLLKNTSQSRLLAAAIKNDTNTPIF